MLKLNLKQKLFFIFILLFIFNCNNGNKKNDNSNQMALALSLNQKSNDDSNNKNNDDEDPIDKKLLKIFTRGRSTFVLTPNNKLFAFGNNQFGQLGLRDSAASSIKTPTEITDDKIKGKVKQIFNGINFTFVLTNDNKLFAFGDNRNGQLGLGDSAASSIKTPTEITDNKLKGKIKNIIGGSFHTLFLTTDNNLFVAGEYRGGRLGLGDSLTKDVKIPTEITDPNIKGKADKIFVSFSSNFVLTTDKKLFAFGSNTSKQLGLNSAASSINTPTEITDNNIKGSKIKDIFPSFLSTFVLTTDDKLFAFGSNLRDSLGLGDSAPNTVSTPTEITDKNIKGKIQKVGVGYYSNFVLTTDKKLFAFGDNRKGELGLVSDPDSISTPTQIKDNNIKDKIEDIFVGIDIGSTHTFILTKDNKLFTFGDNRDGQLGLGDSAEDSINIPTLVDFDFLQ